MAEYAGGFGAGFAPGLAQTGNALALIPLIRQRRAEEDDRLALQRTQTLGDALKLPRNLRGPYLDALVAQLGIDPVIAATFKKADDDQADDLASLLTNLGVENARPISRVLAGGGTGDVMKFLGDYTKAKREQERADKLSGLVGGLEGPATPSGYTFERPDVPPVAPPPQALPMPPGPGQLAGPAAAPPAASMTGTGVLGGVTGPPPGVGPLAPPPAAPRPAPIDLRPTGGAPDALRFAQQARLDRREAELARLGEFTRNAQALGPIDEGTGRFIIAERERIERTHAPVLEGMRARLGEMDKPEDLEARPVQGPGGHTVIQYFSKRTGEPRGPAAVAPFEPKSTAVQSTFEADRMERILGADHPAVKDLRRALAVEGDKRGADLALVRANIAKVQFDIDQKLKESQQAKYENTSQMRDKFIDLSKPFIEATRGFTSVQAAANRTGLAADVALVYGFAKMLDPTGAVREGDYNSIAKNPGIPGWVRDTWRQVSTGNLLDADKKADIIAQATAMYRGYEGMQTHLETQFTDLAGMRKFEPNEVVVPFRTPQVRRDDPAVGTPGGPTPRAALSPSVAPQARADVAARASAAAKATDAASQAVEDFNTAYKNWMKRTRKAP